MSRFVLDANVLLAALAGRTTAPPALLLAAAHNGDFEAVACPQLIQEVRDGLQKPYFRAKLNALEAMEAVEAYVELCVMYEDPDDPAAMLRDKDDDYLVALAHLSGAEAIVTGDADLLDHDRLKPLALDPRSACELIRLGNSAAPSTSTEPADLREHTD